MNQIIDDYGAEMTGECETTYSVSQVLTCLLYICRNVPTAKFTYTGDSIEVMNHGHFALVINFQTFAEEDPDHIVLYVIMSRNDWYYRHVYYLEHGFSDEAREAIQFAMSSEEKSHEELAGWSHYNVDPNGDENTV